MEHLLKKFWELESMGIQQQEEKTTQDTVLKTHAELNPDESDKALELALANISDESICFIFPSSCLHLNFLLMLERDKQMHIECDGNKKLMDDEKAAGIFALICITYHQKNERMRI
ncbi:Cyclin-dependent kinase-like [Trichinella pseudospiralis]